MTPADILAAARLSPLSPVVLAREEWLAGWVGPAIVREQPCIIIYNDAEPGWVSILNPAQEWCAYTSDVGIARVADLSLDLRRPEVRDRLVRCGAPEWCRDSVGGVLGWAIGILDAQLLNPWREVYRHYVDSSVPIANDALVWVREVFGSRDGAIGTPADDAHGRACADLDSLGSGRILEEPDGWYIPLPGGAVGWLPKENA